MVMRVESPAPGAALIAVCDQGSQVVISVSIYRYGDDAVIRAAANAGTWQTWLSDQFAAAGAPQLT
jgi:hypothetical protein